MRLGVGVLIVTFGFLSLEIGVLEFGKYKIFDRMHETTAYKFLCKKKD